MNDEQKIHLVARLIISLSLIGTAIFYETHGADSSVSATLLAIVGGYWFGYNTGAGNKGSVHNNDATRGNS